MCTCAGNICQNTTGGSPVRRRSRKTTTDGHRGLRNWIGFSGWRASEPSGTTGWYAMRITIFSWSRRAAIMPGAEQSAGLRRTARRHLHRVSRSCPGLEANCGAAEAAAQGGGRTGRGSHCEMEVGASGGPPLARAPACHATKRAARGGPSIVGMALRFALNAPPFGLRRAALRPMPTDGKNRDVPGRAQRESLLLGPLDAKFS